MIKYMSSCFANVLGTSKSDTILRQNDGDLEESYRLNFSGIILKRVSGIHACSSLKSVCLADATLRRLTELKVC